MMRRISFENIINVIIYAFMTFFIVIVINQLLISKTNNRNFNNFYGENSRKISVATKDLSYSLNVEALGDDFIIYDTISDISGSFVDTSTRAVYGNGNFPKPHMLEGEYFTEEQMLSDEPLCVIGVTALERSMTEINGEKYYVYEGTNYRVIGLIGLDTASDLDLIALLNWNGYTKQTIYTSTKYMIDSNKTERIDEVFDSVWAQLEAMKESGMDITYENIYYENNIRGFEFFSRFLYFWAAVLLFLNLFIVSARYTSKQLMVVAVKRLVGCSNTRLFFDVSSRYVITALIGFGISLITIRILQFNVDFIRSDLSYFSDLSPTSVGLSVITIIVIAAACAIVPLIKLMKKDMSSIIK